MLSVPSSDQPGKQIHFIFIVPCRNVSASSPERALGCRSSLGSYPDAGVLGAGCAGAPAVPRGRGQGLQVGVVDVTVLLAALLQKRRQMVNAVTRKIWQKSPQRQVRGRTAVPRLRRRPRAAVRSVPRAARRRLLPTQRPPWPRSLAGHRHPYLAGQTRGLCIPDCTAGGEGRPLELQEAGSPPTPLGAAPLNSPPESSPNSVARGRTRCPCWRQRRGTRSCLRPQPGLRHRSEGLQGAPRCPLPETRGEALQHRDAPVSKGPFLGKITAPEGEETRTRQVDEVCLSHDAEGRGGGYEPGGAGGPCTALQRGGQGAARGRRPGRTLALCLASALPPVHAKGDQEAEEEEEAEHYSCSHHARYQA